MRTFSLKRNAIAKVAVLATGLSVALLAATINPAPTAQAYPRAASCAGCHGAATAGTVTATPSTATPAPGASYSVVINLTANVAGGNTGYGIVPIAPATEKTFGGNTGTQLSFTAAMVAPASAGTYSYTVWSNQGLTDGTGRVGSVVYSITVAPVVTIPPTTVPPTTIPPTTVPPTTVPPTTVPPTTIPPTTVPPTTIPPTTVPPTTIPPTTIPPTTAPPVILPTVSGEVDMSPTGALGRSHLSMYGSYGRVSCAACHDGTAQPQAPALSIEGADMERGISCATCHGPGKSESDEPLFISGMNDPAKTVYSRCSSCHQIVSDGDSDSDGDWGDRD